MHNLWLAFSTILIGVGGCLAYFWGSNAILDTILPAKGKNAGRNINRANAIRPWLFILPALVCLTLYLIWPVVASFILSMKDSIGQEFVGLENYKWMVSDPEVRLALRNNLLWVIVVPALITLFGLLAASLTDRLSWGNIAKSLIFMPMAISFIGASVIWKFVYEFRPAEQEQVGLLNEIWLKFHGGPLSFLFLKVVPIVIFLALAAMLALMTYNFVRNLLAANFWMKVLLALGILMSALGAIYLVKMAFGAAFAHLPYGESQTWLSNAPWNNFFLMIVLIWIQTGFAMVILSAALRGIPEETVEAALIDGATPFQIFYKIKVPQIADTIAVVLTTNIILVLKVFDIVLAMTGGKQETEVLANIMYRWLTTNSHDGRASAIAMVIMVLVIPIMVWNIRTAVKEH